MKIYLYGYLLQVAIETDIAVILDNCFIRQIMMKEKDERRDKQ